jgi:HlyD family secretion protein
MENTKKQSLIGVGVLIAVVVVLAVVGLIVLRPEPEVLMGEAEASEYRVSGKVPGRVEEFYVHEGDQVKAGDTLVFINSPEVSAKLEQAQAARSAASAQAGKAKKGARQQQITAAYQMWQKAQVGVDIAKKSLDRVQSLYDKKVVSAQKRDEVEAQYKAAVATANAAKSQYDMALEGAQQEDKEAALALVAQANGAIAEVQSYMGERYLTAPCDGEVVEIYPKRTELIGTGSPVMSIVDMNDMWFTFSVREDLLGNLKVGKVVEVTIPALGDGTYQARVTYLRAMASYATWRATKNNGQYDMKSFDVRMVPVEEIPGLRPGMTAIIKSKN